MTLTELDKLAEEMATIKRKLRDSGREAILGTMAQVFQDYPNIEAVRWSQYTPYFNDGDPCVFSVHEPRLKLKEVPDGYLDDDYNDGFLSEYDMHHYDKDTHKRIDILPEEKVCIALGTAIQNYELTDAFLAAFGDHVQVTITRDGNVDVEDCEHD